MKTGASAQNFSSPAARALVTIQVCGVLSGVRVDGGVCASPVIQRADSAADSGIALADRSLPLTYLKILRAGSGSLGVSVRVVWLECRPELRNHGLGWVRAVERLRNGGVPPSCFLNARNPLTPRDPEHRQYVPPMPSIDHQRAPAECPPECLRGTSHHHLRIRVHTP